MVPDDVQRLAPAVLAHRVVLEARHRWRRCRTRGDREDRDRHAGSALSGTHRVPRLRSADEPAVAPAPCPKASASPRWVSGSCCSRCWWRSPPPTPATTRSTWCWRRCWPAGRLGRHLAPQPARSGRRGRAAERDLRQAAVPARPSVAQQKPPAAALAAAVRGRSQRLAAAADLLAAASGGGRGASS